MVDCEKIILILLTCQTAHYGVFYIKFSGQKYISFLFKFIWLIRSCLEVWRLILFLMKQTSPLQFGLIIMSYVLSIIVGLVLIKQKKYVEIKLEEGLSRLTKWQKLKLIAFLIGIIIFNLSSFKVNLDATKMYHHMSFVLMFVGYFTKLTYIYDQWISPSVVVYLIVFIIIHSAKIDEIKRLQFNVDYFTWLKFLIETKKKNVVFEKNLSIFPSLWLINAFVGTAGVLELLKYLTYDFFILLALFHSLWISSIILVAKSYDDFEKLVDLTRLRIYSNSCISSSDKVVIDLLLNQLVAVKVTASSMVTLDKSLFLPCIGYIITYTLLLKDQFKN